MEQDPLTDPDAPELSDAQLAAGRPFAEAFPALAAAARLPAQGRGRPRRSDARAAVTLRLDPATLARFQAAGPDWRARMAALLDRAEG